MYNNLFYPIRKLDTGVAVMLMLDGKLDIAVVVAVGTGMDIATVVVTAADTDLKVVDIDSLPQVGMAVLFVAMHRDWTADIELQVVDIAVGSIVHTDPAVLWMMMLMLMIVLVAAVEKVALVSVVAMMWWAGKTTLVAAVLRMMQLRDTVCMHWLVLVIVLVIVAMDQSVLMVDMGKQMDTTDMCVVTALALLQLLVVLVL
jgi:hypothetical protein